MQALLGYMRKAILDYELIEDGDHIAVGVSGGKDSVALLVGLSRLRRFIGIGYRLTAVTLDMQMDGSPTDFSSIERLCEELDVPYLIKRSEIGDIIFGVRKEKNPCSLCARMRRGSLHDLAKEHGCNKIALGHHYNDVTETFLMNLFNEGRVGCFSPKSYLSRKDLTLIRPMVYVPEKEIVSAVNRNHLPVVKSRCPADGHTERQWTKEFLNELEQSHPGVTSRIFGAIKRGHVSEF
ncbi:tRNA 2-thiocytidine biosynthesis TtcA family protein [Candidatus Soleaferrea massiliensis]|uniref:tRNA 2-thiocytidine biosynthesis TtcA family protein n=1 Tax=Candidatus Soleaferrea massiliensis TaxID=1470354 RepID=UPI00058BCC6A|nr:tRNA 2-thiocytidine biosynthesis TtcA family protein [Candidatus Soleaferrea massiliensis]